nr:Cytosolic carboxypeptidase 2 [Polyrhizophydium stewartii]
MEEEVQTTNVACERSKLTGQLAVTMVKASVVGDVHEIRSRERLLAEQQAAKAAEAAEANAKAARPRGARTNPLSRSSLRQTLEPSGDSKGRLDYKNIFREQATHKTAPDSRLLMPGALAQSKIVDAPIIAADIAPDETFRDNPDPEYIEASHPAPEGSQSPPDGSESSDLVEAAISLASATDLFRPASSSITSSTAPGVDGADVELDACDYDLDPLVDLFALYTRIKERRIKESANADKREKSKWALFMPPELVFRARFDGTDAPFYIPRSINDDSLVFESRFESGNLKAATRIGPAEYNLEIRKDLHTSGHTQWFYFQLQNMCGNREYTFHITNLMKPRCLYTQGMQPLIYSQRQARFQGIGWTRAGSRFDYSRNPQTAGADGASKRPTFTLTFALAFPHDDDTVLVAHCYPYTYSDLQRYIASVKADARKSEFFRHRVLCKTLCQNNIDLLTITNKASDPDELSARRGIVLTARGFFDFVLGESPQAEYLRKHFIFKVIPMLNPDGVIVGNHRCNLKGYDLNRQWGMADNGIEFAPEIWHARHMITEFSRTRPLVLYCDLHGHNRKHGAFLYGCHNDADERLRFIERVFPFMLSQRLPSCIFFKRCQFQMQRRKEGTSRISLRRSLPVVNSFTLEASFCGTDLSARGAYQFQIKDYVAIGEATGLAIYDFLMSDDERAPSDTAEMLPSEHARSVFATIKQQMIKGDTNVMPEASESSDTTSDDEKLRIKPKKAKKKTKKAHAPATVQERRARLEERKVVQVPTKIEPRRPAAALSSVVLNPPVNPLIVPHVHFGGSMHSGLRSECPIHGLAHPHKSTTFGSSGTLAAEWMRYAH